MYCVGLTGMIASGKSTVAGLFSALGIQVINADQIARDLTAKDQPAFRQIIQHFGDSMLTPTGELNRRQLSDCIFSNPASRVWLEQLLHPLIRKQIQAAIQTISSPYCLIEIPLLIHKSDYPYLNRVLLVLADREQQITRAMARNHRTREHVLTILESQADERTYRALADDVIVNDGSLDALSEKISVLHAFYLGEA